jgi:hypothetical protein
LPEGKAADASEFSHSLGQKRTLTARETMSASPSKAHIPNPTLRESGTPFDKAIPSQQPQTLIFEHVQFH